MELGWIDFSKTERNKVLSILELLGEKGVLDELGIGPIRDGFSDLFFPGTSTLQTRAKYFIITAYILKDLELSGEIDFNKLRIKLDEIEEKCGHIFLDNKYDEEGVIGNRSIQQGTWVKRAPSSVYWAGIRRFQIFKSNKTLNEYLKFLAFQNIRSDSIKKLANKNDDIDDDGDAGNVGNAHLLNIPTYKNAWIDDLKIELTKEEGKFLKKQIIGSCKDSMLAFILENNLTDVLELDRFQDLESIIFKFPKEIRDKYYLAKDFSDFNYFLNTIYNLMVSDNENTEALDKLNNEDLDKITQIDLERIFLLLKIKDLRLRKFLLNCRNLIKNNDIEELKNIIKTREIMLKGENRAKSCHPGEYELKWYAAKELDYRFYNTKNIIKDIFISLGEYEPLDNKEEYEHLDNKEEYEPVVEKKLLKKLI